MSGTIATCSFATPRRVRAPPDPGHFSRDATEYVQADAATVFDRLFTGQPAWAIEVGCLAHACRKLVALLGMDCSVAYLLKLIARVYRLEHLADVRGWRPTTPPCDRHEPRACSIACIAGVG